MSLEVLKARLASKSTSKKGSGGGGGGNNNGDKSKQKRVMISHKHQQNHHQKSVNEDDIDMLQDEVLKLQKIQEAGLNLFAQHEVNSSLFESLKLHRSTNGDKNNGSPLATNNNSSFSEYGNNNNQEYDVTDFVLKMEQELTTSTTAMNVLVDMYKRNACTKETLAEYRETLIQIGVFSEIKIPSFDTETGYSLSGEETVEVGDAAKKVFNARAGLKQFLATLERGDEEAIDDLAKKLEEFVSSGGEISGVGVEGLGRVISGPKDEEMMR